MLRKQYLTNYVKYAILYMKFSGRPAKNRAESEARRPPKCSTKTLLFGEVHATDQRGTGTRYDHLHDGHDRHDSERQVSEPGRCLLCGRLRVDHQRPLHEPNEGRSVGDLRERSHDTTALRVAEKKRSRARHIGAGGMETWFPTPALLLF